MASDTAAGRGMPEPDWTPITDAISVALGNPVDGRVRLLACWNATAPDDHAQRCVLAHYLADLAGDLDSEITWDEVALREYERVGQRDLVVLGVTSGQGLEPSLHLNLADGYLRRGDLAAARTQLDRGLQTVTALRPDGYGAMIRRELTGVERRLRAAERESADVNAGRLEERQSAENEQVNSEHQSRQSHEDDELRVDGPAQEES